MRAFILRRVEMIAHGLGDVALVGSSHSAATLRIKETRPRAFRHHRYGDWGTLVVLHADEAFAEY
jgi:thioredoxin reductase (NADPH)